MAISANTVWEVQTGGSDTNGGGFVTGASGTDWSQQAAAQYSVTDAVTAGTSTITSATANFGTDVVGNLLYIQGGTAPITAGWYEIISRTNNTTIVVDRSTGLTAGTGATLKIGGALGTWGRLNALLVDSNKVYVKAGTYTTTTNTQGPGGPVLLGNTLITTWEGYQTTRGDLGTSPVLKTGAFFAPGPMLSAGFTYNAPKVFTNLAVDGDNIGSSRGFHVTNGGVNQSSVLFYLCTAYRCAAEGFTGTSGSYCISCVADTCGIGFKDKSAVFSVAKSCTSHGFSSTTSDHQYVKCISANNGGKGFYGYFSTQFIGCVAYGNTGDGFDTQFDNILYENCIAVNNGGYGYNCDNTDRLAYFLSSAGYNNTSGNYNTGLSLFKFLSPFIALSGNPFTSAGTLDFSLNNTAGAGALLRGTALPLIIPGTITNNALDIGVSQTAGSSGGGSLIGDGLISVV